MCGITGFLGLKKDAVKHIISGLKMLQNRGYDSAGIASLIDGVLNFRKKATNEEKKINSIKYLESVIDELESNIGIGHTRWATHGKPVDYNSHPHIDSLGKIAIVHNGQITNYEKIKAMLVKEGFIFKSETDTEIVANLISYFYQENPSIETAIKKATKIMQGEWAIVLMCTDYPDRLYCFSYGAPLLIGFDKKKEYAIISSEPRGFANNVDEYIILHDTGDIKCLKFKEEHIDITNFEEYEKYKLVTRTVSSTPDPYPHWTLKEIHEQPEACVRALGNMRRINIDKKCVILNQMNKKKELFKDIDNLILLGCGTSFYAGLHSENFFKSFKMFNDVKTINGNNFDEECIPRLGKTAIIVISQSGETADLRECLSIARKKNVPTIGVINVVSSTLARKSDVVVYLNSGIEEGVASTKAFTSQAIVLSLLAIWFAQQKSGHEELITKYINDLVHLSNNFKKVIKMCKSTKRITSELLNMGGKKGDVYLIGAGPQESIAKEGSLKLKEIGYIHAEGYHSSELKHGPYALLDKETPVIIINPKAGGGKDLSSTIEQIMSRGSPLIEITDEDDGEHPEHHRVIIPSSSSFAGLVSVIPLQLMAYYLSVERKINPDRPRNLAKSVTVC